MVVDGLAASGGYIAAMSADHIVAQGTSLVGSIGVLFQYPNFTDLLKTIGVKVEEIKSSPLKAAPNGYEPTSPEARAAIEALVKDSYAWFRGMVRDRRHMDDATLERVADGRVFTGRQGVELKLVDEIGNEQTAIDWLAKEKGLEGRHAGARLAAQAALRRPHHAASRDQGRARSGGSRLARAERIEALGLGPGDRAAQS